MRGVSSAVGVGVRGPFERIPAAPVVPVLVSSASWSAQSAGTATMPSGRSLTRASDAGYETTSGVGFQDSVGASNRGRIASRTYTGLRIEGASSHVGPRNPDTLTGWSAAGTGSSTTSDATIKAPDGVSSSWHHNIPISAAPNNYSKFDSQASGILTAGAQYCASMWAIKNGNSSYQINVYDGGTAHYGAGTLSGTAWQVVSFTFSATGGTGLTWMPADGRAGAVAAGARDINTWHHHLEPRPVSTYTATSRAAEVLADTSSASSLHGIANVEVSWSPSLAQADCAAWTTMWTGRPTMRILGVDDNNCIEIDTTRRQVRVVVDGVRARFPVQLPAWVADDLFAFTFTRWGGAITGTYAYNGGAVTSLGSISTTFTGLRTEDATLYWYGTAALDSQLEGVVLSDAIYAYGSASAPSHVIYASPSGSGVGTKADPASLDGAITAARAFLPAPSGTVRVVLRGGTYYRTTTIALTDDDNGIEIVNYPGETVILSGGEAITGSWTGPDGSGVYSKSWTGTTRQLYVAGTRATPARSALQTGWTATSGGWTASSSAVAGLSHPEDTEIVGTSTSGDWKLFFGHVASASGTAITMRTADWDAAKDAPSGYEWNVVWYYRHWSLCGNGAGYWGNDERSHTLYYKPRAGETMGTSTVVAATLDGPLITITGTLDSLATGIRIRGITFQHCTWLEPSTSGFVPIQAEIVGSGQNNSPNLHKIPAAVQLYATRACVLSGCTIQHVGGVGVSLEYGSTGDQILGCVFTDTGAAAITIGDASSSDDYAPSDSRARVTGAVVRGNSITAPGAEYWSSVGIWLGFVSGCTVDENTITTMPYSGISCGWGWGVLMPSPSSVLSANTITNNRVIGFQTKDSGTTKGMGDGGGVYLNGPQSGTVVSGNYVQRAATVTGLAIGLYADNGVDGVTITGNAVDTVSGTYWATLQTSVVKATNNTLTGNYYDAAANILNTPDASNTVSGNTASLGGASALAVIAAAGRT